MSAAPNNDYERLIELTKQEYEYWANSLTKYNCLDCLIFLKNFICRLEKTNRGRALYEFQGQQFGYHAFPLLIDLIIRNGGSIITRKIIDDNYVRWFFDRYVNFPDMLYLMEGGQNLNKYAPQALIRMAFEQIPYQEMNRSLVPRLLYLFQDIPRSDTSRFSKYIEACDKVLRRWFRVNLDDILYCAFALAAVATRSDFLPNQISTDIEKLKPHVNSDAMPIIREMLTISRDEYVQRSKEMTGDNYIYVKNEIPLIAAYPILNIHGYQIAPFPKLILFKITKSINDYFWEYFATNADLADFTSLYGEIFREYIAFLLRESFGIGNVFDLDLMSYIKGKRADWIIAKDGFGLIVEAKSLRYPKELKRSGSLEILESFVNEKLAVAVDQCENTQKIMNSIGLNNPDISKVKCWCSLIVIEEQFSLANAMSVLLPANDVLKRMSLANIQIVSALELETLLCSNLCDDIKSIVDKVSGETKQWTFDSYLRKIHGFQLRADNVLDKRFSDFFFGRTVSKSAPFENGNNEAAEAQ